MQYVSTKKASEILGVSGQTLRNWASSGSINFIRTPGGERRYDVNGYLQRQQAFISKTKGKRAKHEVSF